MQPVSSICICGGGSLGHALAAVLGNQNLDVRLLTRRPGLWEKEIIVNYRDVAVLKGTLQAVSAKPSETVAGAGIVIITTPSYAYLELFEQIQPFLSATAILGTLTAVGGFEWITHQHQGVVFGMQRAPYVCRTEKYGKSVLVTGVRENVYVGTRPANEATAVANTLQELLQLNVLPLPNYLSASLAPANPIFHSVRNYSLAQIPSALFYEDWDDYASILFLQCDDEIQQLSRALGVSHVPSIRQHYHANTAEELTKVIRNIESLKGIPAPHDRSHRFFTEDMLINLPYFLHIGKLAGVPMPTIQMLADWAKQPGAYNVCEQARRAGITSMQSLINFY
jgi:opine dehydrogenase